MMHYWRMSVKLKGKHARPNIPTCFLSVAELKQKTWAGRAAADQGFSSKLEIWWADPARNTMD
jgi:hypothetical protein